MLKDVKVYDLAKLPRERRLHEGRMERWSIRSRNAQIVFGNITPQPAGKQGNHREPHDHPFDMLLVVMKGTMMQDVEGVEYEVGPGAAMVVPAFYMHRGYAHGQETASLFEVFAPARRDYIDLVAYQDEFEDQGEDWVKEGTFTHNPFAGNDPAKGGLPLYRLAEIPVDVANEGGRRTSRRSIRTKHAQVVWTDVERKDEAVRPPEPRFEKLRHDRLFILTRGALTLRLRDRSIDLPEGSCVIIPPQMQHALELKAAAASLIDIYAPPRRDLLHLAAYQKEDFGDDGEVWMV
jgi:mannose-6-phosphate isomerase-like protein (cupin superfamily)